MVNNNIALLLETLENNKTIKDKLELISLYQDLYVLLISKINEIDSNLKMILEDFLTKTFLLCINYYEDNSIQEIIKLYLKEIRKNKIFDIPDLKAIIDIFENSLDSMVNRLNYANVIDKYDYDLVFKYQLLTNLKIYIQGVMKKISVMYDDSDTLKRKITITIMAYLDDILKVDCLSIDEFKDYLKELVRNIVIAYYHNGEFNFFNLKCVISRDIIISLDEIERELYISKLAYIIALYEIDNNVALIEESYFRELAFEYDISLNEIVNRDFSLELKIKEFKLT